MVSQCYGLCGCEHVSGFVEGEMVYSRCCSGIVKLGEILLQSTYSCTRSAEARRMLETSLSGVFLPSLWIE